MTTRIGKPEASYSARGNPTYYIELWHDGLKKHRLIKSSATEILQRKAELQVADWEEQWTKAQARDSFQRNKAGHKKQLEANRRLAAERTSAAKLELDRLDSILSHTLTVNDAIDWERLKDTSAFAESKPKPSEPSSRPSPKVRPSEPSPTDYEYIFELGLFG